MFLKASMPTRLITALICLATTVSVLPASLSSSNSPDIDGGLIGGASLKPHDFLQICKAGELLCHFKLF
jgi:hypothetical protein